MREDERREATERERFEAWAEDEGRELCLDQVFMSTWGVPENPYLDDDTRLAYDAWRAALRSLGAAGKATSEERQP